MTHLPAPITVVAAGRREVAEFVAGGRITVGATTIHAWDAGLDWDPAKTLAFAETLATLRRGRGLEQDTWIFVPESINQASETPEASVGNIAVPHVFLWEPTRQILLAWERLAESRAVEVMGAPIDVLRAWGASPERVRRLAEIALAPAEVPEGHLSLRWIVSHELQAAEALSADRVSFEHVSIHVAPQEEEQVAATLTELVGLVALTRPAPITTPGRWLQCGSMRVHLNRREARAYEPGFPGAAPNHIALRVSSVDAIERGLDQRGIPTARGGSLGHQLWWRLLSGTTIEFQQADSFTDGDLHLLR
jgi:hypothetical protein